MAAYPIKGMAYIIKEKSYNFSVSIVNLSKKLYTLHHFSLSDQLLRSGTPIGANVEESFGAESDPDYLHKLRIAYKESRETSYWLRLLYDTNLISDSEFQELHEECISINKILYSMIETKKQNMSRKK